MKVLFIILLFTFNFFLYGQSDLTIKDCDFITEIYNRDQSIRHQISANEDSYALQLFPEYVGNKFKYKRGFLVRRIYAKYRGQKRNLEKIDSIFKDSLNLKILKLFFRDEDKLVAKMYSVDTLNLRLVKTYLTKHGYPNENRFENKCEKAKTFHYVIIHLISDNQIDSLIQIERKIGHFPERFYPIVEQRKKLYQKHSKNQ